jgi:hypothetical protein
LNRRRVMHSADLACSEDGAMTRDLEDLLDGFMSWA